MWEELKPGGGKKWAEASIAAMFYQALEDHILQAMMDYIQQKPAQHVSLHYDGVRVDKTRIEADGWRLDPYVRGPRDGCPP